MIFFRFMSEEWYFLRKRNLELNEGDFERERTVERDTESDGASASSGFQLRAFHQWKREIGRTKKINIKETHC